MNTKKNELAQFMDKLGFSSPAINNRDKPLLDFKNEIKAEV
jgi:hypothetical protein